MLFLLPTKGGGKLEETDYSMSDLCRLIELYSRIASVPSGNHGRILDHLTKLIVQMGLPYSEEEEESNPEIIR